MRHKTLFTVLCGLALAAAPGLAKGPGTIKFSEASFEAAETAGQAVITVERSGGEDDAVSVQYATSDGTATAGQDYTAASGTLSWAAGDGSAKTFTVPLANDGVAEGTETVHLTLSNPTGGAALDLVRGTADLRVLDSGSGGGSGGSGGGSNAGTIKFDQSDFQVLENGGQAVITVERSHGESGPATVQFSTSDGTATAGRDYTATSGTLSWVAGDESPKVIQVPILDDSVAEGTETVRLTLSNPTGAGLDPERSTAVLSILEGGRTGDDNEEGGNRNSPGTFKFAERGFQVIEGAGVARVTVERSGGQKGPVSVHYQTSDGSARAGEDYTAASGVLSWADGERGSKTFEIPVTDDSAAEGNETVMLALSGPTGGAAVDSARGTSTLSILDDDGSTTACVDDNDTLCLADDRFKVEITWRTAGGLVGVGTAPISPGIRGPSGSSTPRTPKC